MAEYSSKLELCSFGLTKSFISLNKNVRFIEQKCSFHWTKMFNVFLPSVNNGCAIWLRGTRRCSKAFPRARVYAKNTPKNYTYPALIDLIAWYLVRLIVYSLCSQPSTSDGLTRHGMPVLSARHFSFPQDSFCFPQDGFSFPQDSFCFPQDGFYFPQDNFYFPQGSFYYLRRKSLLQTL